jgi:hypothetical protein
VSTVFEHQVNLRWRDLDALGHVNHAVFLVDWSLRYHPGTPATAHHLRLARLVATDLA